MARKKKALERFVDALPGSSLPSEGCKQYRLAMSNLRMFVAENCPYGTKVEVCSYDGFEVFLSTSVSYRTACGILLKDATLSTEIGPEGTVQEIAAAVKSHALKVKRVTSGHTAGHFGLSELTTKCFLT